MLYKFCNINIYVLSEKFFDLKKAIDFARERKATEMRFGWSGNRVRPEDLIDYLKNNLLRLAGIYGHIFLYDIQGSNLVVMHNKGVTREEKILFK